MIDIKITVTRGAEEARRGERLKVVATKLREKRLPILALHDYLGLLEINWKRRPQTGELVDAMRIWAEEGEVRANHYVRGRLLLSDADRNRPFGRDSDPLVR